MPEPKITAERTGRRTAPTLRTILSMGAVFAFGALAGRVRIGAVWPLGVAYVAAAFLNQHRMNPYMALAGVLFALCTMLETVPNIAFNFAVVSLTAAALIVLSIVRRSLNRRLTIFTSACAYVLCTVCFKWELLLASVSSAVELLICGILIAVFDGAARVIGTRKQRRTVLADEEIICVVLVFMLGVMGLGDIGYAGVYLRDVFAAYVTMLAALLGGSGVGAGAGAVLGLAAMLGGSAAESALMLAVGAMAGGAVRTLGRVGIVAAFLCSGLMLTLFVSGAEHLAPPMITIALAGLGFAVTPKRLTDYLGRYVDANLLREQEQKVHAMRFREVTFGRLTEVSRVLANAAKVFRQAAERPREETNISYMMAGIPGAVCGGCVFYGVCWDKEFAETFTLLQKLYKKYERNIVLTEADLGQAFRKRCVRPDALIQETKAVFGRFSTNNKWQSKVLESRAVVGEQLLGVSKVIDTLESELTVDLRFRQDMEDRLRARLDEAGVRAKEVCVELRGGAVAVTMKVRACGGRTVCRGIIEPVLAKVCRREMVKEECLCAAKDWCLLHYEEARRFSVYTGIAAVGKSGGRVSGDAHSTLGLRDGRYMLLLCDGMGSGEAAAKESGAAVSLMEDFYKAGFDDSTIVETINKLLILSGREEMFSTMDLCMVDQVSGRLRFTKIGAPHSYIVRSGGETTKIEAGALPLGILDEFEPAICELDADNGDMIVLFTDGVADVELSNGDFSQVIAGAAAGGSAQQAAETILAEAIARTEGRPKDDMTVMVACVKRRGAA